MAFASSEITRSMTRVAGFRDPEFDYQLLRAMGVAEYGGSTVGECLAAAAMIIDGDTRSWARVFGDLADRVEEAGRRCSSAGHAVSARDHLLRASTYHRTAEYYAESDVLTRSVRGERSRRCFADAAALFRPPIEVLSIPFEDGMLPGYLVHPLGGEPRGTLVVIGGFDSTAEELYFQLGAAGTTRGWQVLVFDGPGQTGCMRSSESLCFRPDYEVPVRAVLDVVEQLGSTRPDRIALAGLSLGGYFAARVAAHDGRIRALVADSPIVDVQRYFEALIGPRVFRMRSDIRPQDVTGVPDDLLPTQMAWGIAAVCRRFGVASLQQWMAGLERYRLVEADLGAITCPVLALMGVHEGPEVARQSEEFLGSVAGPSTLRRFDVDEGADAHCQTGNLRLAAQVVYDWLDALFV
ncbi:MAG: alpha/beta hydrolase family protein [Acidimicrobiales bacterium]